MSHAVLSAVETEIEARKCELRVLQDDYFAYFRRSFSDRIARIYCRPLSMPNESALVNL
jgi:hypothetical protein